MVNILVTVRGSIAVDVRCGCGDVRLMLYLLLQIRINFMRIRIQNFDPVVFPLAAFVTVRAKMFIPDPDFFPYRIPEPGAKKALDPVSRFLDPNLPLLLRYAFY